MSRDPVLEVAWAIVGDRKGMVADGHASTVEWASAYIDAQRLPGTVVRLTDAELAEVEEVASTVAQKYRERKVTSMRYGTVDHKRFVASFGAELAVAKLTGKPWGRGDPRRADVNAAIEVRWSSAKPPRLRLYDPDAPRSQDAGKLDRRFYLVSGWPPAYLVHGWATGLELHERGQRETYRGVTTWALDVGELHR